MYDDTIIPNLREDLSIRVVEEDSQKFVVLSDPKGYSAHPVAIPIDLIPLLQMLDGSNSVQGLYEHIKENTGREPDMTPLIELIKYLDHMLYMDSPRLKEYESEIEEYIKHPVRKPVCAGSSYPDDPKILNKMLTQLMDIKHNYVKDDKQVKGVFLPHIDFRTGMDAHICYSAAYNNLKNTDADVYVIFGTSHYSNDDLFMITDKDFETPFGIVETDKELISDLAGELPFDLPLYHLAHREEHSIELQLIQLQHSSNNKNFKILPILTGSYFNFMSDGLSPEKDKKLNNFISTLRNVLDKSGKKVVFLASGDLAHIGRKFGDEFDASDELKALSDEDSGLMDALSECNPDTFFQLIKEKGDNRKICGLPPAYAMLKTAMPEKGQSLSYGQWYEKETSSAVSFGTVIFY